MKLGLKINIKFMINYLLLIMEVRKLRKGNNWNFILKNIL